MDNRDGEDDKIRREDEKIEGEWKREDKRDWQIGDNSLGTII